MSKAGHIEVAIKKWAALFPIELGAITIACWDGAVWVPQIGLIATISLYDPETYHGPHGDLIITTPEELEQFDTVLARVEEVIGRLRKDEQAAGEALKHPVSETLGLRPVVCNANTFAPAKEDIERREQALREVFGMFDAVAARMREVYGLRLPRHIAVWAAFYKSLSPFEIISLKYLGRGPWGIMLWFDEGGLERETIDGLDPRLDGRFRCDPPEFVTVMSGDSDGLHYGLWYDDPAELPSFIAGNYARDSAETWRHKDTIIQELAQRVKDLIEDAEEPIPLSVYAVAEALTWFKDADKKALEGDGPRRWADAERGDILGGFGPALPLGAGNPRDTYRAYEERYTAYKERSSRVVSWIGEAKAELQQGKPAFALVLGRELHWFDADEYRAASLELLCASYEALGRHALAEIARVHHKHRDLKSVGVYKW